jgi:hypothetical protein
MCSCMEVGSVLPFGVSWEGKKYYRCFEDRERTVVELEISSSKLFTFG